MVSGCLPSVSTAFATQSETATGSVHPIAGTTSLFTRAIICLRFDSGIIIIEKTIYWKIFFWGVFIRMQMKNEENTPFFICKILLFLVVLKTSVEEVKVFCDILIVAIRRI